MERLSGILNQTSSNSGYGADFGPWGWLNVATKRAMARPCLHIQTGFPLKGGIVFLSTNYRDNWSLILPSSLKTSSVSIPKSQLDGRGTAGATVPHMCPSDLLPHPLRVRDTLGLIAHQHCQVSNASDDQFVKLKLNSANKSGEEIHRANIWKKLQPLLKYSVNTWWGQFHQTKLMLTKSF